jgi:Protein of unknown function (DUF3352)
VSTLTEEPRRSIPAAAKRPSRGFDRRLTALAGLALAGLVALAVTLAGAFGTTEQPPAAGAAGLVPGSALAYVHLSTDTRRPAVGRAIALASRFPDGPAMLSALASRLGTILRRPGAAGSFDFATDVRPWLGREAAFALLNTRSTTAGSLILLDVRNRARAHAFLNRSGAEPMRVYRGVRELRYRRGTVVAFVRHYLAIGQPAGVENAIDVADGSAPSLRADPAYSRAAANEPAGRVLDAYVSASGVRRVLAPRSGLLGALGQLLVAPDLAGTAISVSAVPGGAQVTIDSALDPALVRLAGHRAAQLQPTLASVLPAGSSLLLDVRGLARAAPRVLSAGAAAGIAPRVGPLLQHLGTALTSEGVDVPRVLALFSGETAVAVTPGHALAILARTAHPEQTRALLANLEAPLAQLFPPPSSGPGQAAEWNDVPVAGVDAHQLSIAPGVELDYAVFRGLVVASTSLRAIGAIARHHSSLADTPSYQAVRGESPAEVTSLLFADFSQLLNLGERMGLTRSARLSALRPDLEKIRTVGLASSRGEADTTAELFLQIP